MRFTKMHGLGNDYIYVNLFEEKIEDPSGISKFVSDRHFGIGGDGLVLIMPSENADCRMRMFNADGSEGEMCGNAIRCIGKYLYDNKMTDKKVLRIETLAGVKEIELFVKKGKVEMVRVDMGAPVVKSKEIPVRSDLEQFIAQPVRLKGVVRSFTAVSMGNPHAVTYVEDVDNFPVEIEGPLMENNSLFPNRVNTEFAQVIDRNTIKMRVWERGSGETLACGTGACAVLVSSVLNRLSERKAQIILKGGSLEIEWSERDEHVYMTGPAVKVFDGEIELLREVGYGKDQ
ncbi:MAG: diaminopimelate epimerase [Eubacteriales bacterium]|nr:diaminopimelate epimerase [Eubacteriales bacterium]